MRLHNQSLPIFALTLIAACSEAKDETPAPKPATEVMQSDSAEAIYLSDLDRSEPRAASQ